MRTERKTSWEKARAIVLQYGWNSMCYQILNPGMTLWFSKQSIGVIGYVETSTHIIVAGTPITKESDLSDVVSEFTRCAVGKSKIICFFGAQQRISTLLSEIIPSSTIVLGAQPVWTPKEWLHTSIHKRSLRAQILRAANKNIEVKIVRNGISHIEADMRRCLHEWIRSRRLPPMHFLVEPNTIENVRDRILCVAKKDRNIIGYCVASPIPLRNGWLIEHIIRADDAPNGTSELLLHTLITEIEHRKSDFITLGLSPLSPHASVSHNHPLWLRSSLSIIRSWGKIFYNFEGLDQFKSKYRPSGWEPVYAISTVPKPTLSTLYAIATAFTGISPLAFFGKACIRDCIKNTTSLSSRTPIFIGVNSDEA
jgi:phosphatidylglycerol lysyltransferase